ncbi:MAG: hypothetical protein VKL39_20135 [Leptolyngbyaceae bacterium]|nr:hypothetical protein [Leptolyngbyaceae bacterium]
MSDKTKVTLYIPPDLHRKLKVKAAVESEPMSSIAEQAIVFYLNHSEIVDGVRAEQQNTHRIHSCPECSSNFMVQHGEVVPLPNQPGVIEGDGDLGFPADIERAVIGSGSDHASQESLVTC